MPLPRPRPTTLLAVALTAALVLAGAGCSSSDSAAPTTAPRDHRPCALLRPSEVAAALSLTVDKGSPTKGSTSPLGAGPTCVWRVTGGPGAGRTALALAVHEWADVPTATKRQEKVDLGDASSYVRWFCRKLADSSGGRGPEAENVLLSFRGSPGCSSGNSTLVSVPSTLVVIQVPTDPPSVAERRASQRLADTVQRRL